MFSYTEESVAFKTSVRFIAFCLLTSSVKISNHNI